MANATPTASPARPDATLVLSVTWAVTAVTAANTRPTAVTDAPKVTAPAAGRSMPMNPTARAAPTTTFMPPTTTSAASMGAWRPTAAARTSSSRPLSSSARVWRESMNRLMSPTSTSVNEPVSKATRPPKVSSPCTGPLKAMAAALPSTTVATRRRSSSVE